MRIYFIFYIQIDIFAVQNIAECKIKKKTEIYELITNIVGDGESPPTTIDCFQFKQSNDFTGSSYITIILTTIKYYRQQG